MGKKDVQKGFIEKRVFLIRGHRVMLSPVLAELYGVEVKVLMQAVNRNKKRFPEDFMFRLTKEEAGSLRSQIVTLDVTRDAKTGRGKYSKYLPYAFTEQGIAMLSSVLRSDRAIQVNIEIMRVFVRIRELISTNKELALRLSRLELKIEKHDEDIYTIFEAIEELMDPPPQKHRRIKGFKEYDE